LAGIPSSAPAESRKTEPILMGSAACTARGERIKEPRPTTKNTLHQNFVVDMYQPPQFYFLLQGSYEISIAS
jgi:hypothetical protein